ncbi:MAG: ABC transporter transmembrane domain-containing protein [Candidatus Promineifilaceae bacterium]|jgi:ATP-binding cassette subfamily B protein
MTTTAAVEKEIKVEEREPAYVPATEKKDDSAQVLSRLLDFMTGGENSRRFYIGLALRVSGLLGLIALPTITGQTLSLNFFDHQPVGQLMSRVTNDSEAVALFYESAVAQILRAIFQVLLITIVMFLVNWQLAVAALTIVPIMVILTLVIQRISTPAFVKMQENMGNLSGFQEESISGHKVIISNRRQDWAGNANAQLAGDVYDVGKEAFFTSLMQMPLTTSLVIVQIVIVLIVGAFMVLNGNAELGTIIAFTGYAALLSGPLSEIANLTSTTLNAAAGGRRVFEIMDEEPTVVDAPDAHDYAFKGGHIQFEHVDFS